MNTKQCCLIWHPNVNLTEEPYTPIWTISNS